MRFVSTRRKAPDLGFSQALIAGMASDGGLYLPEGIPAPGRVRFHSSSPFPVLAAALLEPFAEGDPLAAELPAIATASFDFPLELTAPGSRGVSFLELFHGPTSAFKDVGARFLAQALSRIPLPAGHSGLPRSRLVLVATSGDTGGAVASAFFNRPGFQVAILFPEGKVSPRQAHQLCAWGGNVRAFSVRGTFDDCQRMAKEAFARPEQFPSHLLLSANSINLGRLLPQAAYHAWAATRFVSQQGRPPGLIVPTGNLGNGVAALLAMRMGAPIREVVFALNENRAVQDYLLNGKAEPRQAIATPANAMDVGVPSNLERLKALLPEPRVRAVSATTPEILEMLSRSETEYGSVVCPHTACGLVAREKVGGTDWVVTATAHPAKFESVVEPRIGRTLEIPAALRDILARAAVSTSVDPDLGAWLKAWRNSENGTEN